MVSTRQEAAGGGGGGCCETPASRLSRLHHDVHRVADDFFYRLGRRVARRPKSTLSVALVAVFLCCLGFSNFSVEADAEDLWLPKESLSRTQEDIVNSFFDEGADFASILLEHPEEGGSVLTKDAMDAFWDLHAMIVDVETESGNSFEDLCITDLDRETCAQPLRGISRFWGGSFDSYQATVSDDADVLAAVNVANFPDGGPVGLEAILGNSITYDDDGVVVVAARALVQTYDVRLTAGDGDENQEVLDWQLAVQDSLEAEEGRVEESSGLNLAYFTGRSLNDALEETIAGEVFLFMVTYVIMSVFVTSVIGRFRRDSVERRTWLAGAGVGTVLASGLAAYGVNSAIGVPFTALSNLLPFILVGIGVDDMFVMTASFDQTDPALPVEERMALGLKRCGVSITYTSLTDFCAFMLGSLSTLPAVEYFCLYAATAILFDFMLQITVFTAFLTMDANRQKAGKMDYCCCLTNRKHLEERAKRERGPTLPADGGGNGVTWNAAERGASIAPEGPVGNITDPSSGAEGKRTRDSSEARNLTGVGKWMRDTYTPWLLSWKGKTLVVLATAALLAWGIYGVTQVEEGFDPLDLAADGHFAREYTLVSREYALNAEAQFVPVGVYTPAVDYTNATVQGIIQATDALMVGKAHFSGPVDSWLGAFAGWAAATPEYRDNVDTLYGYGVYKDSGTFYPALDAFLSADDTNARFLSNLAFDENGEIEMSTSSLFIVNITSTASAVSALQEARAATRSLPLEPRGFAFSPIFVFIEQYLVIYDELITNFLYALGAVAALSLLVLGTPAVVFLICLAVVMVDVELLGSVYHWGLELNAITVVELIMAVGLVVDYMVHIVHYYLKQDPGIAKDLRIGRALGEIGPSVVVGATTTFLGVLPLGFASNVIFRVFFQMFLVIILLGFFHGVVFVPVALSLLPGGRGREQPPASLGLPARRSSPHRAEGDGSGNGSTDSRPMGGDTNGFRGNKSRKVVRLTLFRGIAQP